MGGIGLASGMYERIHLRHERNTYTDPVPRPDKPLIRVVSGYESGVGLVTGALAVRDAASCYRFEGGGLLVPDTGDVIETWE